MVAILFILALYVTMVYGPIAALLVELFPTRIRYTSMSLPYHIGNGWFGGFLPTGGLAQGAGPGGMYYRRYGDAGGRSALPPRDISAAPDGLIASRPAGRGAHRRGTLSCKR